MPDLIRISPGTQVIENALAQLSSNGGEIEFTGGTYTANNVTIPATGVMFTRKGSQVTFSVPGGATGLIVNDDFVLGPGFQFITTAPSVLTTHGIHVVGKRTELYGPKFSTFGNQVTTAQSIVDPLDADALPAPYALVYDSLGSVAADWNHLYSPHFEFVYGGMFIRSVSNVMVTNFVARGGVGPGGAIRSHMIGNPAGAPCRVNGIWTTHCQAAALQFTEDVGITRNGGNIITNWTNEPGAGQVGTAAYVESDENYFGGAIALLGGDVGFAWGTNAAGNIVDTLPIRTAQGGVGPAVDTGPISSQIYR